IIGSNFVNGAWKEELSRGSLQLIDPDTERPRGTLMCANADLVGEAVQAAVRAREPFAAYSVKDRLSVLEKLTELLSQNADSFAQIISSEIGAPITFARSGQVQAGVAHLRSYRDALGRMPERSLHNNDPKHRIQYEPVGVAALITPWNWPLNQVILKVGAALAAGCPMVLKPSEYATATATAFAELVAQLDLPEGVFNLITGDGATGKLLVDHPHVSMISFTGSTETGRFIAQRAALRVARRAMELGGKSANLLFADCDVQTAVRQGVAHCFRNAGQSCNAASRMLVERPIYDRVLELAVSEANAMIVGKPFDPGTQIGPLVNAKQHARVRNFIDAGKISGARLIAGGSAPPSHLQSGYYIQPTVFADVEPSNDLFQKEIFGPVLTITPFDTEDEAIHLANATQFGLAAYIQTRDMERADRVASRVHAGMVQINGTSRAEGAPFGGVKASGYGRESGIWGIRSFQDVKSISGVGA
ncbi:MAG: aldehyde dehydrogenase family protein, partial [Pseudomonadota bacterium]